MDYCQGSWPLGFSGSQFRLLSVIGIVPPTFSCCFCPRDFASQAEERLDINMSPSGKVPATHYLIRKIIPKLKEALPRSAGKVY